MNVEVDWYGIMVAFKTLVTCLEDFNFYECNPIVLERVKRPAIIILHEVVLDHESITSLAILTLGSHFSSIKWLKIINNLDSPYYIIQSSPSSLNPAIVIVTRFFMKTSSLMSLGFLSI